MATNEQGNNLFERRVVYRIPDMVDVVVQKSIPYQSAENDSVLALNIYRPIALAGDVPPPVIIFVFGFADKVMVAKRGSPLKNSAQYDSWARIMGAAGFAAITYETDQPDVDIHALISYIRQNSGSLNIDGGRIGLWSCSGNVPTALSVLMREPQQFLKCAVFYYGAMLDWKGSQNVANAAEDAGFVNPCQAKTFDDLPRDIPMFIVRAGRDFPPLNETIDHFIVEAISRNMPLTFVNYAEGQHGFDILDDKKTSHEIIKQTITFIEGNLM
jgi:hypothetical protein